MNPDYWPSPLYWFTFAALGAGLSYAVNASVFGGSHPGGDGALGIWLLSILVSAGAAVTGCILAMFQQTRLPGIAFLSAGLGGLLPPVAFVFL